MADSSGEKPGGAGESGTGLVHRTDLVVSLIIIAICVFFYYLTTTFEEVSMLLAQNVGPEQFPRIVLVIIMILAALLPFEHILHAKRGGDIDSDRAEKVRRMPYYTVGVLFLLVAAMPFLGTLLSTIGVCLALPILWGERRWRMIVPYAILFPLLVAYVFDRILLVQYEPGALGVAF